MAPDSHAPDRVECRAAALIAASASQAVAVRSHQHARNNTALGKSHRLQYKRAAVANELALLWPVGLRRSLTRAC